MSNESKTADNRADALARLRCAARDLRTVRIDAETMGTVGYLAGAIQELRRAIELGYEPTDDVSESADHWAELEQAVTATAEGWAPPRAWLARMHFHSALHRIAACADRLTKHVKNPGRKERATKRQELFASTTVEGIYCAVNKLKHDVPGTTICSSVPLVAALSALEAELRVIPNGWRKESDT